MKKSTRSLLFVMISFIFALSIVGQPSQLNSPSFVVNQQDLMPSGSPMSSYDKNVGVQPLEINDDQLNDLGMVEIEGFRVNEPIGIQNFNKSDSHITYDHDVEQVNPQFDSQLSYASSANAKGNSDARNSTVTILLNETVKWSYTEDTQDFFVGFSPYIQPATLYRMYMNGTEVDPSDYTITQTLSHEMWFNYNFTQIHNQYSAANFTLLYQYTVKIPVTQWRVNSYNLLSREEDLASPFFYLNGTQTSVNVGYNLSVMLGALNFEYNVSAQFKITPPSPTEIYDLQIDDYSNQSTEDISIVNNIFEFNFLTNLLDLNTFSASFKADFTVEVLEQISDSYLWSEDRIINFPRQRERDYKLTISEGPENLEVSYFTINDTSIYFDDLKYQDNLKSALHRGASIKNMNTSTGAPSGNITEDGTILEFTDGISFLTTKSTGKYILYRGEVDIVTINYNAVQNLQFTVTDSTKNPISGVYCKVLFADHAFGTKMNKFVTYEFPARISDQNGQVEYIGAPMGEYTIQIYSEKGQLLQNLTASAPGDYEANLLVTQIVHFPSEIIIFVAISAIFLGSGLFIYNKRK